MAGNTQQFWQHALPKRQQVLPRLNFTFDVLYPTTTANNFQIGAIMVIQLVIEEKLNNAFNPDFGGRQRSHQHNVPPGSESHFKVALLVIVSR